MCFLGLVNPLRNYLVNEAEISILHKICIINSAFSLKSIREKSNFYERCKAVVNFDKILINFKAFNVSKV